jgi:hypothetical protein
MPKPKILVLLNILGFLIVLTLNALANGLPLNGYTTGELSALYPNLFVPAGFTFAIWGIIYLFLLGFVAYQSPLLFSKRKPAIAASVKLIGLWFFISCLANAGWIVAWHFRYPLLSLVLMLVLLFSLIQIYRNLGMGHRPIALREKWWVQAPFSLYLGWISVATIANTTAVLVHSNFSGFGLPEAFFAAGLIIVAGLLGLYFLSKNFDFVYALVIIWACFGIFYKQQYLLNNAYPVVVTSAAAVGLLLIYRIAKQFRNYQGIRAY